MEKKILVYADKGVSTYYLRHLIRWLRKYLMITNIQASCVRVDAHYLLTNPHWEEDTDLLIIPGGADIPYHQALSGQGTHRILQFIHQGGRYLGICAGAYFGASRIYFREPDGSFLEGVRDLCLFPGTAIGPAYEAPFFSYTEPTGVRAAQLLFSFTHSLGSALFNGGCYFDKAETYSEITVEARYQDLPHQPACIVSRQYGSGEAVLSGVHIEYLPDFCTQTALNVQEARKHLLQNHQELEAYTVSLMKRLFQGSRALL